MERIEPTAGIPEADQGVPIRQSEIRAVLERVLADREFQATENMRGFLRFVVEQTLAGNTDQLKGYTIATEVFARTGNFDPTRDPVVRIQAGRLRQALERYYLVTRGRDPIRIDIPKGRYVPRFSRQRPEAEGLERFRGERRGLGHRAVTGPSVAVLPLENLNAQQEQHFFTIGLAEELVTELNRFQDIITIPCQRAVLAAAAGAAPEQFGRRAGARFVLGGTVRTDRETVKVSMRLVDASTDRQVWAGGYKHDLEAGSLIETQEEIARSVVAAVASEHGIIARRLSAESRRKPPAELDTYEAMLRYYSYQLAPSPEASKACFAALRQAVEREPKYGPAWSALATLHCQMYGFDVAGFDESLGTALEFARRGVFLEPGSQIGRLILAYASYLAEDLDTFHQEIATTLALNPNSPYHVGTAGYFHVMLGDFTRGMALLNQAIVANPYHPNWFHTAYFLEHFRQGEFEHALLELDNHSPLRDFWVPVAHAACCGKLGRTADAAPSLAKLQRLKPDFTARGAGLLRRTIKSDVLIAEIADGLRLAGLTLAGA